MSRWWMPLGVLAALLMAWALAWPFGVAGQDAAAWMLPASFKSLGLPASGHAVPLLHLLGMVVVFAAVHAAPTVRQAALRGLCMGTVQLAATFWWLFVSMHTYAGLWAPLAVLAVVLLAAGLSLYLAAAAAFYHWASPHVPRWCKPLVWAALWLLAEWARATWWTGFPWGSIGYAYVDVLAFAAPWVGVYGMGALVAGLAAAIVQLCLSPRLALAGRWQMVRRVACALVLCFGSVVLALGASRWVIQMGHIGQLTQAHGSLMVGLLQGNIAQEEKFQPETGLVTALQWYRQHLTQVPPLVRQQAAQAQAGTLVIAPETAVAALPQQIEPAYWSGWLTDLGRANHAILVGVPLGNTAKGYSNSVWGMTPDGARQNSASFQQQQDIQALAPQPYQYDKHHLVPFGEFIPPAFKWFVALMNIPLGDFNRGHVAQAPFSWAGQRIAPHVCYEDLFGEELAQNFANPEQSPTVLVNVSNLAWFGNTAIMDQHLQVARLRALELGRPMLRATNTGATVMIDHQGAVTHALARQQQGTLWGLVQGRTGQTPYAHWTSKWGLWPLVCWAMLVLLVAAALRVTRALKPNT